jgi:hypothetical protein
VLVETVHRSELDAARREASVVRAVLAELVLEVLRAEAAGTVREVTASPVWERARGLV